MKIGIIAVLIGLLLIGMAFVVPNFAVVNAGTSPTTSSTPIENTTLNMVKFEGNGNNPILSDSNCKITMTSTVIHERLYGGQTFSINSLEIWTQAYQQISSGSYGFLYSVGFVNLSYNGLVSSYSIPNPLSANGLSTSEGSSWYLILNPTFNILSGEYPTSEQITVTFMIENSALPYTSQSLVNILTISNTGTQRTGEYYPYNPATFGYGFIYPMTNIGHYYIFVPTKNTWVELTQNTVVNLNFTSYPASIEFAYVMDNGTTTDLSSLYLNFNGNNVPISLTNQTQINGYTAYSIQLTLPSAGSYTINGYIGTTYNTNIQLMSFIYNGNTGGTTSINSTVNYEFLIIGMIITISGGVLLWRKI